MGHIFDTIAVHPEKCDGCGKCVEVCSWTKAESADPRESCIRLCHDEENEQYGIALCRQCAEPRCVDCCPSGALSKDESTGIVTRDEERCVSCGLCTLACVSGGISAGPSPEEIKKCDLCAGDPECVRVCTRGALEYNKTSEIYREYGDLEDLVVPGISTCLGCNSELLLRHTLRRMGPDTIMASPPGCLAGVGVVGYNGMTGSKIPVFHPLLTNTAAMLAGAKRYYNRIGRDVTMLAMAGDGGSADVGFQSLSGAAERGEQMVYICVDNEGYMNTGVQRSGTTPFGSWTSTTPVGTALKGKARDAKPLALLMALHNCEYVATASTAFMEDYYEKLDKAVAASKKGMAYIHVFSPCPTGWRFQPSLLIETARKAVETNIFPLWEYEHDHGRVRFTRSVENPLPVEQYLSLVGKFRHLDKEQIRHIQSNTEARIELLQRFTRGVYPDVEADAGPPEMRVDPAIGR